ncbi:MAG: 4Fe-4S binding protein [Spirochaetaceae bacterium]|nr:4Fe-4S binding protein [Spirochaetaceae bacterium]MBR2461657.1 4Fe-4S binding protein [Spirochaetaceae bacterium]
MIITILLLLLFMITVGLVSIFIFCILIPSITQDKDRVQKFIFASDELKISSHPKKSLEDTGRRAVVLCSHEKEFAQRRINYQGPKDCILFTKMYETEYDCFQQCLGFGTCVAHCPQRAIQIINHTAVVLTGCIGCGRCVDICPKHVIKLVPKEQAASQMPCGNIAKDTTCTACQREKKVEIPPRKVFKLWKLCYNIFYGKKKQE